MTKKIKEPDYRKTSSTIVDHIFAYSIGFVAGFSVLFIFYKIIVLAIIGGLITGVINVIVSTYTAMNKRKSKLRIQFYELLEAMSVSM
ncbi:MAG: hypothetical protein LBC73_00070, partial [Oscillospiraceae bacterium]|nr:hypothetical protein [Oscillospiraceae bacterium]